MDNIYLDESKMFNTKAFSNGNGKAQFANARLKLCVISVNGKD